MLAQSGIRHGDTLSFLARYGRDIAGALQIWDIDDPTEPQQPTLRPVTDIEVRQLLENPVVSPLGNDIRTGKSSLGGVQPKIVIVRTENGWAQALGGYPTTHILKPQPANLPPSVIHDEEYGNRIAQELGLANYETSVAEFAGLPALVIERYDRLGGERIHQEDFNQVLGASGSEKYQEYGGVVSLRRVSSSLISLGLTADLRKLAKMLVATTAIGNLDMHTKNLGLLHASESQMSLAPAYDFVPQAHTHMHMHNDGKFALAVNKKYQPNQITADDLADEISSWGVSKPNAFVSDVLV